MSAIVTQSRQSENVSIRKLLSMGKSEYHVSIPRAWVSGLGLSSYLKLTKLDNTISIEGLSL